MSIAVNARDTVAGITLLTLSGTGLYLNTANPLGTASRMGPGYMPMVVFILLGILGAVVLIAGLRGEAERLTRVAWRELALILGALLLFGILLERFGLAAATVTLVVVSGLADRDQTLKGIVALAVFLVALSWLVFIKGLSINVPFLPPFLSSVGGAG